MAADGRRSRVDELTSELKTAKAAEEVDRVLDLRDALTEHLRGDSLHAMDQDLAGWITNLTESRGRSKSVDWEVAGWVARALDSLGDMPETESLRAALPVIRRRAGLCQVCGRAVAGGQAVCGRCQQKNQPPSQSDRQNSPRPASKDRP